MPPTLQNLVDKLVFDLTSTPPQTYPPDTNSPDTPGKLRAIADAAKAAADAAVAAVACAAAARMIDFAVEHELASVTASPGSVARAANDAADAAVTLAGPLTVTAAITGGGLASGITGAIAGIAAGAPMGTIVGTVVGTALGSYGGVVPMVLGPIAGTAAGAAGGAALGGATAGSLGAAVAGVLAFEYIAPAATTGADLIRDKVKEAVDDSLAHQIARRPLLKLTDDTVDLDAIYSKIVYFEHPSSWMVLEKPDEVALFRISAVKEASRADYLLTAKTTRVMLDGPNLADFETAVRETTVFAQSDRLMLARVPVTASLPDLSFDGADRDRLVLEDAIPELAPGRMLIVSGRVRPEPVPVTTLLPYLHVDGADRFVLEDAIPELAPGRMLIVPGRVQPEPAPPPGSGPRVSEAVRLLRVDPGLEAERGPTLVFESGLAHTYERATVAIAANVVSSTHGETRHEVLGSGDASRPFQEFALRETPLTYVVSPAGALSTLKVYVNGVRWTEVDALYGAAPHARIYTTRVRPDGRIVVQFGDGVSGARLPTGSENVRATYRVGVGSAGLVAAGQLQLLMTRALGVQSVTNLLDAGGAEDPESLEDARANAPLPVLTLGRVVSLQDYADFARAFPGVAKSHAVWAWIGGVRGVFLTVAAPHGQPITAMSDLHDALLDAATELGDPYVPVRIVEHVKTTFHVAATVIIDAGRLPEDVRRGGAAALRSAFSFDARRLGQPVWLSEVTAAIQGVPGVTGVDVDVLYTGATPSLQQVLIAATPVPGATEPAIGAELLTLDSGSIDLEVRQ